MSQPLFRPIRDPAPLLHKVRHEWGGQSPLWVFAYASLIWRPEFEAAEQRAASVHGWHRALQMTSRINRGTPELPGLVFALVPGGSCRGMVYRLRPEHAEAELERLWAREMVTAVYDPKFLPCRTSEGTVRALAFTLSRRSPSYTGPISEESMVSILRHASGRYGRTLDYLIETATCLRTHGIRDHSIEKLVILARRHGLHGDHPSLPTHAGRTHPADAPPTRVQDDVTPGV